MLNYAFDLCTFIQYAIDNNRNFRYTEVMEHKKITIADIAEELKISRTTVSKALNGGEVPPKTRRKVIDKAVELGYKSFNMVWPTTAQTQAKRILILSSRPVIYITFFIHLIRGIETDTADSNIELLQYTRRPNSPFHYLADYINEFKVDGIICLEIFKQSFINEVLSLNIPCVFFDYAAESFEVACEFDVVLTENIQVVKSACRSLIGKGCKTFGYVGDITHCRSFYERALGMREALFAENLPYDPQYSILLPDAFPYGESHEMVKVVKGMKALPDCFVCANDFIAIGLMSALKKLKYPIPDRVRIFGFENSGDSKLMRPQLSTVHTGKTGLGRKLVEILLQRISDPSQRSRTLYLRSNFIPRETT